MESQPPFSGFTGLYPITKTLRFELIPQGNTLEKIQGMGLLQEDEERQENYLIMKNLMDKYHKEYIEDVLAEFRIPTEMLEEFQGIYFSKEDKEKKKLISSQNKLRKLVSNAFSKNPNKYLATKWKELFKKEFLKKWLPEIANEEELKLIESFANYTTYFSGFFENRRNLYTDKEQSTAISYRIVHENLPKFLNNARIYHEIVNRYPDFSPRSLNESLLEIAGVDSIDQIFEIDYFNYTLSQSGITNYNTVLGGRVIEDGNIQGLNGLLNEFQQKNDLKRWQVPQLAPLFKQILSDRETYSNIPEAFEEDDEVLNAVFEVVTNEILQWDHQGLLPGVDLNKRVNVLEKVREIFSHEEEFQMEGIFLPHLRAISDVCNAAFGTWKIARPSLEYFYDTHIATEKQLKNQSESFKKKRDNWLKQEGGFSIGFIEEAVEAYLKKYPLEEATYEKGAIWRYFKDLGGDAETASLVENINAKWNAIETLVKTWDTTLKKLAHDREAVKNLKEFLDAILDLIHFLKRLKPKDMAGEKDEGFYGEYLPCLRQLECIQPLYNKTRNYFAKKPYSTQKFKVNLGNNGNFLGGWVDSYTEKSDNGTQNNGYLFRKRNAIGEYDYYLGISKSAKLFRAHLRDTIKQSDQSEFERLDYYQLKSQTFYGNSFAGEKPYKDRKQTLHKVISEVMHEGATLGTTFSSLFTEGEYTPEGILGAIRDQSPAAYKAILMDANFQGYNQILINELKDTFKKLSRMPQAEMYSKKDFEIFSEVRPIVEYLAQNPSLSYFPVSQTELNEALEDAKRPLFLFKITNKDLSFADTYSKGLRKSRGRENLHTMYFRNLMEPGQNTFDLGTGEIFYRKLTQGLAETTTIHSKNEAIQNKNRLNPKETSTFGYDIIKDKRFTTDRFKFHLSTKINYQGSDGSRKADFNDKVREYLIDHPEVNIIGIDRGERHLLYVSIINQKGEILKQFSLNEIINHYQTQKGETQKIVTPYHQKLSHREKQRDDARKSWSSIQTIKELKEGYLSQVVHQICKLMIEYHAIVIMEDLNSGFKRGRQKVEKQVYQKFEKMLIDKLNYLVFKEFKAEEPGGVRNGYQLTPQFESFKKIGKQFGFLFYVPPSYTSKIDPLTGFVDLLKPHYKSMLATREFIQKFQSIRFNFEKNWFEFQFDYKDFSQRKFLGNTSWKVATTPDIRYAWNKELNNGKGGQEAIQITAKLQDLLGEYEIPYGDGRDLRDALCQPEKADFYKTLLFLMRTTLHLRHNNGLTETAEEDFILSPVLNKQGKYFDSRKAGDSLPDNADANGAYHIALKGNCLISNLRDNSIENNDKLNIDMYKWLNFAQEIAGNK